MRRVLFLVFAAALLLGVTPVVTSASDSLFITTAKAPVTPDGTTAGAATDFVMTYVDRDPAVDGIGMKAGGTATAILPPEFVDVGGDAGNTAVLVQGWPQSPPAPPPDFIWTTSVTGNTITLTLDEDFLIGDFGPGPKQMHLLLNTFRNPVVPGRYPVHLEIKPDPASDEVYRGVARVSIQPAADPSVEVVSVFSGGGPPPPFNNPFYQTVSAGDSSLDVGMYLWEAGSSVADGVFTPMVDAELVMSSASSGRLIQNGVKVGEVRIQAPRGASDYAFTANGPSVLGAAAVTGFDTGILVTSLATDPAVTGTYVVKISLDGGNSHELFITAE